VRRSGTLWLALGLVLLAGLVTRLSVSDGGARGEAIRVAFAGPVSGPSREDGLSAVRAVRLIFEQVNRAGGVDGRPLELEIFDDANDPERAVAVARRIADQRDVVAVIGHNFSTCSIAAGAVYAERGLPAISTAATSVAVTRDNPWYFRTVFNDTDQGQLVVLYLVSVLGQQRFGIVHESSAYGAHLAEVMQAAAPEAGASVSRSWSFDPGAADLDERLAAIARAATGPGAPSALVLAMQPDAGVQLVKRLRDADYSGLLLVTDSLSSQAFVDGFKGFPEERLRPGFYTDGIYASTPFLFDAAGERAGNFMRDYVARHLRAPDWYSAFAADAALVIAEALRRAELSPGPKTIEADRAALREALAAISRLDPVEGITGANWFDAVGDAQKPVPMGRFHKRETVSAFGQLRLLSALADPEDLDERYDPARVVTFGDRILYRTDVARVGARGKRIGVIDFDAGTFEFDFHLWFRQGDDTPVEDVVFTNAVEPVVLGPPVDEFQDGEERYRLYNARGTFRADTLDVPYGRHILALSLHHRERTRDDLVFAVDSVGMDLGRASGRAPRLRRARELLGDSAWTTEESIFFESAVDEHALGHPRFLGGASATRPYSQLTIGVSLKPQSAGLRGLVPPGSQRVLLVVALTGSAVLLFLRGALPPWPRWLLQSLFAFLVLMTAEPLIGNTGTEYRGSYFRGQVARVFDLLWWLLPAFLVNLAVTRFVWAPAEQKTGRPVPSLLSWSVAALIYLLAVFGVVAFVYDYTLTGVLATSGVVAMIVGLAVQLNITNLFAGVALNLERPFRVGDWIMVHGRTPEPEHGVIGQVVDINWRTTRLQTADDTEIVVPNGIISEKTITNFMAPGEMSRFELVFRVDQTFAPERVLEVIQKALDSITGPDSGGIVADPRPKVKIRGVSENAVEYLVRYRLVPRDISPNSGRHLVNSSVLRALHDAGMELATPRRRIQEDRPT